jgi:hypothetical protein
LIISSTMRMRFLVTSLLAAESQIHGDRIAED